MLTSLLKTITKGKDLNQRESSIVMEQIMEGTISDVQLAGFLAALTTKGASEEEITLLPGLCGNIVCTFPARWTSSISSVLAAAGLRPSISRRRHRSSSPPAASASPSMAIGPRRLAAGRPMSGGLGGQYLPQSRKLSGHAPTDRPLLFLYAVLLLHDETHRCCPRTVGHLYCL